MFRFNIFMFKPKDFLEKIEMDSVSHQRFHNYLLQHVSPLDTRSKSRWRLIDGYVLDQRIKNIRTWNSTKDSAEPYSLLLF